MPHEIFADAIVRPMPPRARRQRRLLTLCSIGLHIVVLVPIATVQMLSPGPFPTPRWPTLFQFPSVMKIVDIPVPAASRRASDAAPSPDPVSPDAAPLREPDGVRPEPAQPARSNRATGGVEGGVGDGVVSTLPGEGAVPGPPPPPPAPAEHIRLHSGMTQPRRVVDVQPVYPRAAIASRKEGYVILEAILDARGNVESVRVLRSDPLLQQAAIDAVKQWKYTPALLNGVPVTVVMTVTVNFTLR